MGVPSVFIRTSGCNLRCTWCDTPYTSWQPEGTEWALDEILKQAQSYGAGYVVVTGGEPMIAPEMVRLTELLRDADYHITIETAGTVYLRLPCDLMSISPKLANSTPSEREGGRWAAQHERLRYQPAVLRELMSAYPYQLKFVVAQAGDVDEIRAMVGDLKAARDRIVLMPEGIDAETLRERGRWLVEICKQERWRFTPRLHMDLWGNQRGV